MVTIEKKVNYLKDKYLKNIYARNKSLKIYEKKTLAEFKGKIIIVLE